jgi:hypothetical protein
MHVIETGCRHRLAMPVTLCLVLIGSMASTAAAGHGPISPQETAVVVAPVPAPPRPYFAYRPVYPVPGTKPLYLSSYAGANYPSVAPSAAITPAEFRLLTGRKVRPAWFVFGRGW